MKPQRIIDTSTVRIFYPMQEGTGSAISPKVGSGNGTFTAASWSTGPLGRAINITTTSQGVTRAAVGGSGDFTMRCLIKPTNASGTLFDDMDLASTQTGGTISLGSGVINVSSLNSDDGEGAVAANASLTCAYSTGKWNLIHITVASNGDCVAYLNGTQTGTGSIAGNVSSAFQFGGNTAGIFKNRGSGGGVVGQHSHFAIFNRVMSAAEVAADAFLK